MSPRAELFPGFRGLAFAAGLVALAVLPAARAEIKVGDAFPALAAAGLEGGEVPATAGRVVLVDFWASWCAPCKTSFPVYGQLHAEFAPRGLMIVAVGVDDRRKDYDKFLKQLRPPFLTLHDARKRLVSAVSVPTMPTAYLIGRDGRVRFIQVGFHGAAPEPELRAQIEALLNEKPAASP